ncbi:tetratricopeptide repeat protein 28-like [Stylophora pistillata]|uniref:tetratricopeptide repeat protein 28-like n=1 Tax=Stylophora pistillata TaxID=50429 RepID=UPI000C0414C1|nr:tetratricopeptide repeat protein 28-like [Stylophora pistillata]
MEKALAIRKALGNRDGEASSYGELGTLFHPLGQYDKAREYMEKALAINKALGNRDGEATSYGNLGTLFQSLGQYEKAQEYLEKALAIKKALGSRDGEAAREYLKKALDIKKAVGDRGGEATIYGTLSALYLPLGKFGEADKCLERAMAIRMKVVDRIGEVSDLTNLGIVAHQRGLYERSKEYHERALAISIEAGRREGEVVSYMNLGSCFHSIGKYDMAEKYLRKGLRLSRDIRDILNEFKCLCQLTMLKVSEFDFKAVFLYLFQSIEKFDTLRGSLKENDELQTSLLEEHGTHPYKMLSRLLSSTAKPEDALYVEELRRARGLADLMATQYSLKEQITGSRETWCGIQNVIPREGDCACLYISIDEEFVRFWVLKATRAIL